MWETYQIEKEHWDKKLAAGEISPEEHKETLERLEWGYRRADYVEALGSLGILGKIWWVVAFIVGFWVAGAILSSFSWHLVFRVAAFMVISWVAAFLIILPRIFIEHWREARFRNFSDARLSDAYSEHLASRGRRRLVLGILVVLSIVGLAATVPSKLDHERAIRPVVNKWASTIKADGIGESIAKLILGLGVSEVTSNPEASVIDVSEWTYLNLFLVSLVVDTNESRKVYFVSWGAFNHVHINSAKFEH